MDEARHGLSHILAREWVSDCLIELRQVRHAEVESEWISEGVAWPEGAVPPDHVHVYVTVPYGFDDGMVGHLADFLAEAADRDPRFGYRFASAHLQDFDPGKTERVDSSNLGKGARRLTFDFSVRDPDQAALKKSDKADDGGSND